MSAPTVTLSIPDLPDDVDMLTAALAYAACGWYVLPVRRGTKHPGSVVGDHWQDAIQSRPEADRRLVRRHRPTRSCCTAAVPAPSCSTSIDPDKLPDVLRRHLDAAPFQSTRPDVPGRGHYVFAACRRAAPSATDSDGSPRVGARSADSTASSKSSRPRMPTAANTVGSAHDSRPARRDRRPAR